MAQQAGIKLDASSMQTMQQPQTPTTGKPQGQPKVNVGKEARSPVAAASPLKAAINNNAVTK